MALYHSPSSSSSPSLISICPIDSADPGLSPLHDQPSNQEAGKFEDNRKLSPESSAASTPLSPIKDSNGLASNQGQTRSVIDSSGGVEKNESESSNHYDDDDEYEIDGYAGNESDEQLDEANSKINNDKSLTSTWVQMELEALEQEQLKIDREAAHLEKRLRNAMESGITTILMIENGAM